MHNYVLAMLVQMKYFIIKIIFCNFLKFASQAIKMMLQTSVKRSFSKHMHGDKFTNYLHQSDEQFIAATFPEKKYTALMNAYNLLCVLHSTRFLKLLKENAPCLNGSNVHGVNYVSIREKTGNDAEELLNPCTLYDMMERISRTIRIKPNNVKNEFNGSFMEESPLPFELLILLNLLMMEVIMKILTSHYL